MFCQLYDIAPQLRPFVKVICTVESNASLPGTTVMRVLPDACVELFVNYSEEDETTILGGEGQKPGRSRSFVVSRMGNFMEFRSKGRIGSVAVCFRPGSAYHFFPLPMQEISDRAIDLRDLWQGMAIELEERVATAPDVTSRIHIVQQFLIRQLAKNGAVDTAIDFCIREINRVKGQLPVKELSLKTGVSNRQLARRFNHCAGLAPKEFAGLFRFLHSLRHLKKYPSLSLTDVAYESGYYDQAHFIHTYKTYAGLTPGQLLAAGNVLY